MDESGAPGCGVWRWGIGPYLDGLFAQGNFGIVTALQLALVRRPAHTEVYLFTQKSASRFREMFEATRRALVELRGPLGAIKYINQRQIEMTVGTEGIGVSVKPDFAWMGFGVIHGTRGIATSLRHDIRRLLRPHVSQLVFLNDRRLSLIERAYRFVPGRRGEVMRAQAGRIRELLQLVNGVPRTLELHLAYQHVATEGEGPLNPIRDGVGLMWYAPVIPLKTELVLAMVAMIERTLGEFGFAQAVSLTTIDERCAIGVIPVIYNRPHDKDRAHACFRTLWQRGTEIGCYPYRMNVEMMSEMADASNSTFWDTVQRLKNALDPGGILSPGRYSPSPLVGAPRASR